jgi:hypothetical protein
VADLKERLVQGDKSNELRQGENQDEREKNNKLITVIYLKAKIWSK